MKSIAALTVVLSLGLVGCNDSKYHHWDHPLKTFDATVRDHSVVQLEWIVSDNVSQTCNNKSLELGLGGFRFYNEPNGCAFFSKHSNKCTIITHKKTTMHTLGHEVRHCFQGNWH